MALPYKYTHALKHNEPDKTRLFIESTHDIRFPTVSRILSVAYGSYINQLIHQWIRVVLDS